LEFKYLLFHSDDHGATRQGLLALPGGHGEALQQNPSLVASAALAPKFQDFPSKANDVGGLKLKRLKYRSSQLQPRSQTSKAQFQLSRK
jgi:hypothetical protein